MFAITLIFWDKFLQSHWESLHWQLREQDPSCPPPRQLNKKAPFAVRKRSSGSPALRWMWERLPKGPFWSSDSGICTKDCLIWTHMLVFKLDWKNSEGPPRVCFPCGPILVRLSSLLGKPFSSSQSLLREEINRDQGLQRHLALKIPKPFNFSLGRKLGSTGEDSL